jgi:hypothetical protein
MGELVLPLEPVSVLPKPEFELPLPFVLGPIVDPVPVTVPVPVPAGFTPAAPLEDIPPAII